MTWFLIFCPIYSNALPKIAKQVLFNGSNIMLTLVTVYRIHDIPSREKAVKRRWKCSEITVKKCYVMYGEKLLWRWDITVTVTVRDSDGERQWKTMRGGERRWKTVKDSERRWESVKDGERQWNTVFTALSPTFYHHHHTCTSQCFTVIFHSNFTVFSLSFSLSFHRMKIPRNYHRHPHPTLTVTNKLCQRSSVTQIWMSWTIWNFRHI